MDGRTFQKLSSIDNAGCNLEGDDVTLLDISALAFFLSFFFFLSKKNRRAGEQMDRTCASFRSLIGIPIVLVNLPISTTIPQ